MMTQWGESHQPTVVNLGNQVQNLIRSRQSWTMICDILEKRDFFQLQ